MESAELSLIEISGGDDSLLQPLPPDDFSNFGCSPLQISRSDNASSISMTSSVTNRVLGSALSYNNKENLNNSNKSGISSLSIEPQKMKKSRKPGGYKLRKSLAWDKAFLTEEGVLDSSELCMITGVSDGENLLVIDEQGRDSLAMNADVVCASANLQTLEGKELPSGQPNKRNARSSSLRKQDSLTGGRLASVSKSSQKVPQCRVLNKTASEGSVSFAPIAPASQKRILNTGTTKIMTQISKIPRVPVSKQNSPLPFQKAMHCTAGGSLLKCTAIAQPEARKNVSSTLSANVSSSANGSSVCTTKLTKPSAVPEHVGKDLTFSSSEIDSLTNCKAQHTNKMGNHLENTSNQGLPTGEADLFKPIDGGGNRKNAQVEGIKPSGLRMPSPSLRFFGEGNIKPPNLKSSISTSRNSVASGDIQDSKQTKLSHGAFNHDAIGKPRLSSNMTEKCSTLSFINPTTHTKAIQGKCSQLVVQRGVPLGDKIPGHTNNLQCRYDVLDGFDKHYTDQKPNFLKDEESDRKNNDAFSSHVESLDANSKNTIVLGENGTADENILDNSFQSCFQVQLTNASGAAREVQPQLSEEMGCHASVMNEDAVLGSKSGPSRQKNYILAVETGPSTDISHGNKTPCDTNSNNGLDQFCSEGSMHVKLHAYADDEQVDMIFDGELLTTKLSERPKEQDNGSRNLDSRQRNCSVFCQDKSFLMNFKKYDSEDISNVGLEMSAQKEPELVGRLSSSGCSFLLSNDDAVRLSNSPISPRGEKEQPCSWGHGIVDTSGSCHGDSIPYNYCTENTTGTNSEADKHHILNDELRVRISVVESDDLNLKDDTLLEDRALRSNKDKSYAGVSYGMLKMNSSVKEVEDPTDSISFLSNNGRSPMFQTTDLEFQSSVRRNKDDVTSAVANIVIEESSYLQSAHSLPPRDALTSATLDIESELDRNVLPEKYETRTTQLFDSLTGGSKFIMNGMDFIDEESEDSKRWIDDHKLMRPASNAVPFSEEWLAAIESAGEEILTLKTGAVQHSPPEKSVSEPGPWSPVKRKSNNVVGPFDCTKHMFTRQHNSD